LQANFIHQIITRPLRHRYLTDGHIKGTALGRLAPTHDDPERLARDLVKVGLWDTVDGGWQVHDYHDYQPSSEDEKEKRRIRSEAGRKGGLASGKARRPNPNEANRSASREANRSANGEANTQAQGVEPRPDPTRISTSSSSDSTGDPVDNPAGGPAGDEATLSTAGIVTNAHTLAIRQLQLNTTEPIRNPRAWRKTVAEQLSEQHWATSIERARAGWTPEQIADGILDPHYQPRPPAPDLEPDWTPEQRAANQAASADARARARAQLRRNQPPPTEHPDDGLMRPSIEGDPDATTPNGDPS
jgi:hypothetical protein